MTHQCIDGDSGDQFWEVDTSDENIRNIDKKSKRLAEELEERTIREAARIEYEAARVEYEAYEAARMEYEAYEAGVKEEEEAEEDKRHNLATK